MERKLFDESKRNSIEASNEKGVFSLFQINESAEMVVCEIATQLRGENRDIFLGNQEKYIRAVLSAALKMVS